MRNLFFKSLIYKKLITEKSAWRWTLASLVCLLFAFQNCSYLDQEEPAEYRRATEIALAWNHLALDLERHTVGYRPPVTARMFAYVEMAAYEASLPGLHDYISMDQYVSGYERVPVNFNEGQIYLPASLNAAYASMLHQFFASAPENLLMQITQLEKKLAASIPAQVDKNLAEQSAAYGKSVAEKVWAWSKTDREGHDGHLYNYDHDYEAPVCEGCWQPTGEHPSPALLPYWGQVRPFLEGVPEIPIRNPVAYEVAPGSAFYTEAMEVFSVSQPLSKENKWIAEYWSDDLPGLTCTPSGRWISIANQAFEKVHPAFPLVMETYLKTALAISDAGVAVWRGKYQFNVERPETFIAHQINPDWKALHDTPSFPAYPSGHAAFGAAAAEVLTDALGSKFALTDRTHEKRPEFASSPRTYSSFAEMARENAASRVLLGVHYRMDCEEGLRLGKLIGQKAIALQLHRKEAGVMRGH